MPGYEQLKLHYRWRWRNEDRGIEASVQPTWARGRRTEPYSGPPMGDGWHAMKDGHGELCLCM